MNKKSNVSFMDKHKNLFIKVLYAIAVLIMFLGLFFSFYSIINHIAIPILSTSVHGMVLGLLVFYLGLRNYLSVSKLQKKLSLNTSKFLWQNFRKNIKEK
ncbi:hypothetical protein [Anaerosacchariphilus polymeriproducens]|uniref:Uncharacterized protein n=1 Tax=Anaerosacchariphilus polymeriproducens TaxID=1812858 RepID=A0A371AWW0_9FIRM|nr:hypothetical protein [Anaerosacchariphilus polymeriproducens]RDU24053.1 hypothetical protein DWV06_07105 [Anaerosacchariphilus polymeriproducens]